MSRNENVIWIKKIYSNNSYFAVGRIDAEKMVKTFLKVRLFNVRLPTFNST